MRQKSFFLIVLLINLGLATASASESSRVTPVVEVFKKASPSVVNVSTEKIILLKKHPFWGKYGQELDSLYEKQSSEEATYTKIKTQSIGSGVIIHKDGLIITNAHVIHRANSIYVTLHDGTALPARLIAINPVDDLALLEVQTNIPLQAIQFAKTENIMIGETAIAIGNPYGLKNSVTTGVVSGTNRQFAVPETTVVFKDLIQTDASINAGNSGGALLNLDGELMGINLAVVKEADNIGFAIPSSKIEPLTEVYEEHKESQKRQQNMAHTQSWVL